ncbi:DUF5615 family PIN-like protein [Pseudokineococcus marinus]|uniref:DUF5615 family PIN-like protein n=3 Tax=Pseudokineococcus marinus TaxID=351215 RepID=A0A849BF77_9ACTN|nr:DUF5615 family PIN-like protein [Pseudokineococcus marinus]NNH21720.1 DUF5615 family PIN-like protein [Pseudokineococcus marinus]
MRLLLDAQLPVRLARALTSAGHDVVHTSDLPRGNASTDRQVREAADQQGRVVVTKDRDFRDSHLLQGTPKRLLLVVTGNTSNAALLALFEAYAPAMEAALEVSDFVEVGPEALVQHPRP